MQRLVVKNCQEDNLHKTTAKLIEPQPFPKQALVFTCLQYKPFENTLGKGEIARNEQFLLFPKCFQPIWITLCQCHQI